jgi:hypothetical protein
MDVKYSDCDIIWQVQGQKIGKLKIKYKKLCFFFHSTAVSDLKD